MAKEKQNIAPDTEKDSNFFQTPVMDTPVNISLKSKEILRETTNAINAFEDFAQKLKAANNKEPIYGF